jgi:hypothetical protein
MLYISIHSYSVVLINNCNPVTAIDPRSINLDFRATLPEPSLHPTSFHDVMKIPVAMIFYVSDR